MNKTKVILCFLSVFIVITSMGCTINNSIKEDIDYKGVLTLYVPYSAEEERPITIPVHLYYFADKKQFEMKTNSTIEYMLKDKTGVKTEFVISGKPHSSGEKQSVEMKYSSVVGNEAENGILNIEYRILKFTKEELEFELWLNGVLSGEHVILKNADLVK